MDDDVDDVIDKILDASEACLLISNIYATANDLKFLQEDNMDKIVKFVQFQMRETIFPSYDPVFTVNSMKKGDNRKKKSTGLSRNVQLLYTKLVELTKIFVTLFDNCSFVDTIVLAVSTLAVEPFFVDNIETMQFACLELVTTVCIILLLLFFTTLLPFCTAAVFFRHKLPHIIFVFVRESLSAWSRLRLIGSRPKIAFSEWDEVVLNAPVTPPHSLYVFYP